MATGLVISTEGYRDAIRILRRHCGAYFWVFTSLVDAPAEQYMHFCEALRGAADLANIRCRNRIGGSRRSCRDLFDEETDQFFKLLTAWRSLAMRVRSGLNLAAKLNQGQIGTLDEWMVWRYGSKDMTAATEVQLNTAASKGINGIYGYRDFLAEGMRELLDWARPMFRFSWDGRRYDMHIWSWNGTLCAIAFELAFAISGTAGLAFCSGCGKQYEPSRRPNPNRNRYCPRCGRSAAVRDAARRWRQKQKPDALKSSDNESRAAMSARLRTAPRGSNTATSWHSLGPAKSQINFARPEGAARRIRRKRD